MNKIKPHLFLGVKLMKLELTYFGNAIRAEDSLETATMLRRTYGKGEEETKKEDPGGWCQRLNWTHN